MTISAYLNDQVAGPHVYSPEGPFGTTGNFPLPSIKPGQVVIGDSEGAFTFVTLAIPVAVTYNQGDFFCWDNSYNAGPVGEIIAASEYFPGTSVGTLFLGGSVANPAAQPAAGNIWSYTFAPGVYGVWMQRYGTSLMNLGALSTGATLTNPNTTAAKARINGCGGRGCFHLARAPVGSICNCPLSRTFTGNTVAGSAVITGVNTAKYLVKGMQITGTGFPAVSTTQQGTFITDIQGSTVTVSQLATATNTGTTFTALNSQTTGQVTNGSKQITKVPFIPGLYPNQIVTGTGIVGLVIQSIMGIPGNYTINLVTAATAGGATNIQQVTPRGSPELLRRASCASLCTTSRSDFSKRRLVGRRHETPE
jgi:hypothetical protein